MSKRIEKIIELAKTQNLADLKPKSTDVECTLTTEELMEWEVLYEGIGKKELREDRVYLMDFLQKIERSHGGDTRAKKILLEALVFLENKKAD